MAAARPDDRALCARHKYDQNDTVYHEMKRVVTNKQLEWGYTRSEADSQAMLASSAVTLGCGWQEIALLLGERQYLAKGNTFAKWIVRQGEKLRWELATFAAKPCRRCAADTSVTQPVSQPRLARGSPILLALFDSLLQLALVQDYVDNGPTSFALLVMELLHNPAGCDEARINETLSLSDHDWPAGEWVLDKVTKLESRTAALVASTSKLDYGAGSLAVQLLQRERSWLCECCSLESQSIRKVLPKQPFRLMDLPPEMRTLVYYEVLAPTCGITLDRCTHHLAVSVCPQITPALLATCKQIHHEAKDIIYENEFMVTLLTDYMLSDIPLFSQQLPQHVGRRITKLTLCVVAYELCDGQGLSYLRYITALRELRIMVSIAPMNTARPGCQSCSNVVKSILQYVPSDCVITFGAVTATQQDHMCRLALVQEYNHVPVDSATLEQLASDREQQDELRTHRFSGPGPADAMPSARKNFLRWAQTRAV